MHRWRRSEPSMSGTSVSLVEFFLLGIIPPPLLPPFLFPLFVALYLLPAINHCIKLQIGSLMSLPLVGVVIQIIDKPDSYLSVAVSPCIGLVTLALSVGASAMAFALPLLSPSSEGPVI